jgi:hypothetical protein
MARKEGSSNWSHKTDVSCDCGYLERSADNPDIPIRFDEKMNEYHFVYERQDGIGGNLLLRHCPFCGGRAPESKRAAFFAVIPSAEESRLLKLTRAIHTVDDAVRSLGIPDNDYETGMISVKPEKDGNPPVTEGFRTLIYRSVSVVADIHVRVDHAGRTAVTLQGKHLREQPSAA